MKLNRKNLVAGFAAVAALLSLGQTAFSQESRAQISDIQAQIRQKGAKWVAGETSLSNLSTEEWMLRVGLNFTELKAPPIGDLPDRGVPANVDWRSNGGNYVSAVKDQKRCGSCWAFSMTAGLESYSMRVRNQPGSDLNLSEQVLISCSGVGSCNGGTLNADYLQTTGLPEDSAYPYTGTDGTCSAAAQGWQNNTYTVSSWGSVSHTTSALKAALAKYGPLPTAMMVYEDLMHYKSGVYSYTTGKKLGGHAVLLVGYDDAGQYFIVKNSWGPDWGEGGFFRIGYSELSSAVNFGLSTIAYKSAAKGEADMQRQASVEDGQAAAWARVAPMFQPLQQWNN